MIFSLWFLSAIRQNRARRRRQDAPQEFEKGLEVDSLWRLLELQTIWVKHAETKALGVVAGGVALAGALLATLRAGALTAPTLRPGLLAAAVVLDAVSLLIATSVLLPRTRAAGTATTDCGHELVYFAGIAGQTLSSYSDELISSLHQPDRFARNLATQVWQVAKVAQRKMRLARYALALFGLSGIICVVALAFYLYSAR